MIYESEIDDALSMDGNGERTEREVWSSEDGGKQKAKLFNTLLKSLGRC